MPVLLLGLVACGQGNGADSPHLSDARAADRDTLPSDGALPPRDRAWVIFGADTVVAEIADTPEAREQGLMNRRRLDPGEGMLFVFEREEVRSFWMKDTYIPLDIAFIDSSLRIVDIQQMEPETEELHEAPGPVMFALEVPQGWFEAQGIEPGDQAEIVLGPR